MIAGLTLAVCLCVPVPDLPPPEPVLVNAAATAPERQALREIAHAYDVVAFVDAYTTPTTSERTATTKRPLEVTATRRSSPPPAGGVTGTNCGGDLPDCSIMQCESGGSLTAQNPSSSASGKWQIISSTWGNFMGYPTAASAPEEVQDAKARELWNQGRGAGHWEQCR